MLNHIIALNRGRLGLDDIEPQRDAQFCNEHGAGRRLCVLSNDTMKLTVDGIDTAVHVSGFVQDHGVLVWSTKGGPNPATMLTSPDLLTKWPELDARHGSSLTRLLTLARTETRTFVTNVYAATDASRTQLLMLDGMNVHDDGVISI